MFLEQMVAEGGLKIHARRERAGQVGIEGDARTIAEALIRLFAGGWRGAMGDGLKNAVIDRDVNAATKELESRYLIRPLLPAPAHAAGAFFMPRYIDRLE